LPPVFATVDVFLYVFSLFAQRKAPLANFRGAEGGVAQVKGVFTFPYRFEWLTALTLLKGQFGYLEWLNGLAELFVTEYLC
jgi:hypothetical protein